MSAEIIDLRSVVGLGQNEEEIHSPDMEVGNVRARVFQVELETPPMCWRHRWQWRGGLIVTAVARDSAKV